MSESSQVGIYFLFGENDQTGQPRAYIGQTGNLGTRLKQHNEKKDFWNRAIVALSLTHSLTVAHAHFLEWLAIKKTTEAERYELDNQTLGTYPHTPAPMEAECREIFETIDTLLTTLGFPLFAPPIKTTHIFSEPTENIYSIEEKDLSNTFYCRTNGVDGQARYTEEGLVILKGSFGRLQPCDGFSRHNTGYVAKRQALIDQGILKPDADRLVFTKDMVFKSPSPAAVFLLGRAANGWTEWKDAQGRTLADVMKRNENSKDRNE
nr:GIY-YIG nuclease family protein [Acetobacter persici]